MHVIDTHAYVDQLVAAGIPENQARVQVRTILELVTGDLATRQDLQMVKKDIQLVKMELNAKIEKQGAELNARIDRLDAELKAEIKAMDSRMDSRINRMSLTMTLAVSTIIGVLMTIYRFGIF